MSDERLRSKVEVDNGNPNIRCQPSTSNLKLTLKSWPVIAAATIGLCYLTQTVAKWFGIELPDQANIELVRRYAGWNRTFLLLCAQVLVLMPAIEELIFRYCLFRLPIKVGRALRAHRNQDKAENAPLCDCGEAGVLALPLLAAATVSSILFSAAHYLAQPWPDAAFIALFFFGLAQCWLYKKTDRLWCAILNHGLFNLTNLVLLFILPEA